MSDEMREARTKLRALADAAATGWRIGLLKMTDEQANADAAFRGATSPRQITALLDELERVERERDEAVKLMSQYATEAGFAKGKLEMSEAAGVVDMWREHAQAAEARATAAEARLAEAVEVMRRVRGLADIIQDDVFDDCAIKALCQTARTFMEKQG